jgi:hypothetical protein
MKAILHFENHYETTLRIRRAHLEPNLERAGLTDSTEILFQDYVNRDSDDLLVLSPSQAAKMAMRQYEALTSVPERLAWIIDLDGYGGEKPDPSYGLCVLQCLAHEQFGQSVRAFLANRTFLCVILTMFPESLAKPDGICTLSRHFCDLHDLATVWPQTELIQNEHRIQLNQEEIERAYGLIQNGDPRILFALSHADDEWLARVIVHWLSR